MKTIKTILIIISILVVAFFFTGLLVKETNYSVEITVEKPVNEVFTTFNNPKLIKNWIPELKSITPIQENPGKTGSSYKMIVVNNDEEINLTEKVMAYVPNEKVTLFFDAENMLKKDDYTFIENKESTTIKLNASCKGETYLMACVFPFFKGVFKEQDQTYLNNFKAYIEN